MMRSRSILLILFCGACVDRINFDIRTGSLYAIAIDGYITDQPGPYRIELNKAFDIESRYSTKTPVSAKQVTISDDHGTTEILSQPSQGIYQTSPAGIRGTVGNVYKLRIELLDGRVYESIPDTLLPSGRIDSIYYSFKMETTPQGSTNYGFDVFFNSTASVKNDYHFLWKFIGTYQVETNPELYSEPFGEGRIALPRSCSSYIAIHGQLIYVKACECCTCWVDLFNDTPIVSDNQLVEAGHFKAVRAAYIPITQWTFMHQVHAEVRQMSLSRQAFTFWKAVKAQKEAITSLFQPVTGKVISNFDQVAGPAAPIEGLFYATAINSKSVFITRNAVPNQGIIPAQDLPFTDSCLKFPYATNEKPAFWRD